MGARTTNPPHAKPEALLLRHLVLIVTPCEFMLNESLGPLGRDHRLFTLKLRRVLYCNKILLLYVTFLNYSNPLYVAKQWIVYVFGRAYKNFIPY